MISSNQSAERFDHKYNWNELLDILDLHRDSHKIKLASYIGCGPTCPTTRKPD